MASGRNWWGDFEIDVGQTLRWQIGPTSFWITRGANDWRVASKPGADPFADHLTIAEPVSQAPDEEVETRRFALRSQHGVVRLLPALADRPVVVKTEKPLYIPASEEATLFIGSPLWLQVHVGAKFTRVLDAPIFRPSDTWFGPDTLSGELCYASQTQARLTVENLPRLPHRAVSAVHIKNKGNSNLFMEKMKVPVGHLSLFVSETAHLWTDGLMLDRAGDSDAATVQIGYRSSLTGALTRVSAAREKVSKGFLLDAFGSLLNRKAEKEDERIPRKPGASSDTDT